MSDLIKIRFLVSGTWGDQPGDPNFDVKPGYERDVSSRLANIAIDAGKAEYVSGSRESSTGNVEPDERIKFEAEKEELAEGWLNLQISQEEIEETRKELESQGESMTQEREQFETEKAAWEKDKAKAESAGPTPKNEVSKKVRGKNR